MTVVYTVGHSTRTAEAFVALLCAHDIACVADVRRFPASRRFPHFGQEPLAATLAAAGVAYRWFEALGGRRSRRKGSPHTAWKVAAFAGYADHMDTPVFRDAVDALVVEATRQSTAIMCAEAVPYSCHRRLISDWLELHGTPVEHILSAERRERHKVTPFARLDGDRVLYAASAQLSLLVGR